MSRPWMPLYVSDYLADTRRLTTLEHGAYMLLIMEYWLHGGLPDDDGELATIAGLPLDEWMRIRPRISRLFKDGWRHKRIDEEIAKASLISERRKASAERRWNKTDANAMQLHETCNARARVPQPQPQPQNTEIVDHTDRGLVASQPAPRKASRVKPKTQIAEDAQPSEKDRAAAAESGLSAEQFRSEWRRFRDHHRAKGSLMADWSAAWRTWLGNMPEFQRQPRASPTVVPIQQNRNGIGALWREFYEDQSSESTPTIDHEPAEQLPFLRAK